MDKAEKLKKATEEMIEQLRLLNAKSQIVHVEIEALSSSSEPSSFITLDDLPELVRQKIDEEAFLTLETIAGSAELAYTTVQRVTKEPRRTSVATLVRILNELDMELVVREK